MKTQQTLFGLEVLAENASVVNVATVPQRSPFRYPGGKTWIIPWVRKWLKPIAPVPTLVEPFAGGGIVSLTAAFERLAATVKMIELDAEVAAVWQIILSTQNADLATRILEFDLNKDNVLNALAQDNKTLLDLAFCTILKNRTFHGGILAKGSGLIKLGESGKGLRSRWYAKTLHDRIRAIELVSDSIEFWCGDGLVHLRQHEDDSSAAFFIDPPYTVAGRRLYNHFEIDHAALFAQVAKLKGNYLLTYDDTEEIRMLAQQFGLPSRTIPMKTTHHITKNELLIANSFDWLEG